MKAKPLARWVSRSRARNTLVTRPNRSNRSRISCSSANSLTCRDERRYVRIDPETSTQGATTYVCNSESSQIVLLETTTHLLASGTTSLSAHVRRNVAGRTSTQTTSSAGLVRVHIRTTGGLLDGSHGVLEGTAGCEMLAAANTTLDLLVLELVLHGALLGVLLGIGGLSLPVRAGTEDHVLTDGGGVEGGARRVALLEAELGPRPALGDLWVDVLSDDGGLDPASDLHFLVVIVETVGDDRLGAVFVLGNLGCGQR
jgi:hypothetical protein